MADAKRSTRESMHDAAERSATPRDDAFYVGYAKMPAELTRFLRGLLPALLLSSAVLAWLLARAQNDPGDGLWDSGVSREFSGLVLAEPYPHLRITGESGAPETLLLVEVGKFGGGHPAGPFHGSADRKSVL